ncbi:hypothetical protein GALMADRAFT_227106 [Galerina marginata CBS 339.88]|uniref:Granulins domain-containing protein n=1 Tax=Galerina marginata (strain CBS 339.88) TaxID=685588 RepID=A0A067T3W2_GALM3|nr:hypothetical protein GALMADRAFT_227106 [Galerina marginata CBS 339.88]
MPALFTAFVLLLQCTSLISASTTLRPPIKTVVEPRSAIIRGLIDLDQRQTYYYCPAPAYSCVYNGNCCVNSNYPCCRGGVCCYPGTYCVLASNGNIGCCDDGEICSGPVGNPTTSTIFHTTTSTRKSTFTSTSKAHTETTFSSITRPDTSFSSLPEDTTTSRATTSSTASFTGNSTADIFTSTLPTFASSPDLTSAAFKTARHAAYILALSTFLCLVFTAKIL